LEVQKTEFSMVSAVGVGLDLMVTSTGLPTHTICTLITPKTKNLQLNSMMLLLFSACQIIFKDFIPGTFTNGSH